MFDNLSKSMEKARRMLAGGTQLTADNMKVSVGGWEGGGGGQGHAADRGYLKCVCGGTGGAPTMGNMKVRGEGEGEGGQGGLKC